jgi:hypothetical protein
MGKDSNYGLGIVILEGEKEFRGIFSGYERVCEFRRNIHNNYC